MRTLTARKRLDAIEMRLANLETRQRQRRQFDLGELLAGVIVERRATLPTFDEYGNQTSPR